PGDGRYSAGRPEHGPRRRSNRSYYWPGDERVWLARKSSDRSRHLGEVRLDVRGGAANVAAGLGVAGERPRDGIAEGPLHPGNDGVPEPVCADALSGDPGQVLPEAHPQPVVAPVGDRLAVAVPQQLTGASRITVPAFVPVPEQVAHQRRRDR